MNRLITRLILTFAAASLTFTLLPLLESGGGTPLIAVLDRGQSLIVYSGFLIVFGWLVLPAFVARDPVGGRRWPWVAVAATCLVFAAIPLVFTAYISGVSAGGLLSVLALVAMAFGVPLLLSRVLPAGVAVTVASLIGTATLFAVPGLVVYLASVGCPLSPWVIDLSSLHWLYRVAALRQVPDPALGLVVATGIWLLAVMPLGWTRRWRAVATPLAVAAIIGWSPSVGPPAPQTPHTANAHPIIAASDAATATQVPRSPATVVSLTGGVGRAGLRTALRVTLPPAEGVAHVGAGADRVAVPRDGAPHRIILALGQSPRRLRIETPAGTEEVPLPLTLVPEDRGLVGWLVGGDPQDLGPGLAVAALDPGEIPTGPGALEAFDRLVITARQESALSPETRAALRRWVALGGRWIILGSHSGGERPHGAGVIVHCDPDALRDHLGKTPVLRPTILDTEFTRTFAPPDWQEMDLSRLLLFAFVYHGAFGLAFLLPLVLDSRKALGVYLASVGFVVVVVAGLAFHVLGQIFLRDNQVYTHAVTLLVAGEGSDPRMVTRQLLCFASMSQERRSIAIPYEADVSVYLNPARDHGLVRAHRPPDLVFDDVTLDRFEGKLVLRVDDDLPLPIRIVAGEEPGTLVCAPVPGVADPLGLGRGRLVGAVEVRDGTFQRRYRALGRRLVDDGPARPTDIPPESQVFVRKLLGHFAQGRSSYLLLHFQGLQRADRAREWLWIRDLGGYLVVPRPEG